MLLLLHQRRKHGLIARPGKIIQKFGYIGRGQQTVYIHRKVPQQNRRNVILRLFVICQRPQNVFNDIQLGFNVNILVKGLVFTVVKANQLNRIVRIGRLNVSFQLGTMNGMLVYVFQNRAIGCFVF